ncbi:unnamed protein product [Rhizophagus irregularis]|nr:unnamed protein product [Rhizophagus irregularis]
MDNMDTTIIMDEEEVKTWVNNSKPPYMKAFFDPFQDIFDKFLTEVVKCKKIEEYIDLEKMIIKSTSASKPGKIPIRLNKPETKVPAVYYFLSLFLIKFAGVLVNNIVEGLLRRELTTAAKLKRIEMRHSDLQQGYEDLEKIVDNNADSALTNGLVIQDLENKIRNLEADIIAKERIILEKSEANNILWGKIKALEEKEENLTRKGLWIKKESDYIDENGDVQELNRRSDYKRDASRLNSFRMEWEQQSGPSTRSAPSRRHNQWRKTKGNVFSIGIETVYLEILWLCLSSPRLENPGFGMKGFIVER